MAWWSTSAPATNTNTSRAAGATAGVREKPTPMAPRSLRPWLDRSPCDSFWNPRTCPSAPCRRASGARQRPRTITISIDGAPLGRTQIGERWTIAQVPLRGRRLTPGWHQITMAFDPQFGTARADVDWLWLGQRPAPIPPNLFARTGPLALGGRTFRALLAPTSRTYAFHLQLPPWAKLIFDFGGHSDTLFTVRARVDGGRSEQVFQDRATPGKWREATVDLHRFAGHAVRLELETTGDSVSGWGDPEIMVPRRPPSGVAQPVASRPRGVILLVMDTARADVFSPFNRRSRVQTPTFDRLASRSAVFANAYVNENWTKPSVASILSGLYPSSHGAKREPDVLSGDVALLPEVLQRRGFATAAFIANGYCSDKFGFQRGWATYRNYIRENRPSDAAHVFADALKWLDQQRDRPFFLYLQTIDPHVTYSPPVEHLVEAIDLLPTILETLGLPPRPELDGVSLLPTLAGRPPGVPAYAVSEFLDDQRALIVGRWKLLAGARGWRKLFDLQDDPQERSDLAARAPIARRLCEQHLAEALATPAKAARFRDVLAPPRRFQATKVKHDPELRRQLEALGYFGAM